GAPPDPGQRPRRAAAGHRHHRAARRPRLRPPVGPPAYRPGRPLDRRGRPQEGLAPAAGVDRVDDPRRRSPPSDGGEAVTQQLDLLAEAERLASDGIGRATAASEPEALAEDRKS